MMLINPKPLCTAVVEGKIELSIGVYPIADLAFELDCNSDRRGSKTIMELPRRYQTLRGAKMAAARLIGEKITWVEAPSASSENI